MKNDSPKTQSGSGDASPLVTAPRQAAAMLLLLVVMIGSLRPQTLRDRGTFDLSEGQDLKSGRTPTTIVQPPGVALEGPVNPEEYYVGPSDALAMNIWISPPVNFVLTVTPEGTLIVPTVGEIRVSDLTLAEAKRKIIGEVKKKYISGEPTVTLVSPRPIVVAVTGNVLNPGSHTLTAVDRADRALEEANKPTMLQRQEDANRIAYDMSTRNILLKHRDGSSSKVDIAKFLATKESKLNPYLREGDVVIVPRRNLAKNVIGVYGEVNVPGRYEYVRGDSIKDALRLAQGFTRLALVDSIEFSRLSEDGRTTTSRLINGSNLLSGVFSDVGLEPGDRIVVRAKPDLREDYRATIVGEVLYPGTYPITKSSTRLLELLEQAGGITEFASLKSAELNRRSINPEQVELERLLSLRGSVSPEDSAYYYLETDIRIRKEIVTVDFEKLLFQKDSTQNVLLQTEDYVVVPSTRKTIYVFGQVVSPGHIPYVKGESKDYYVKKAGGFTERARPADLKIIKSSTKQWLDYRETAIEEGDYVWVPKEPERTFAYYMTVMSQAAAVLSVVVGIAVVVVQVTK